MSSQGLPTTSRFGQQPDFLQGRLGRVSAAVRVLDGVRLPRFLRDQVEQLARHVALAGREAREPGHLRYDGGDRAAQDVRRLCSNFRRFLGQTIPSLSAMDSAGVLQSWSRR